MLLDADVLIDLSRENPAAHAWLATLTDLPSVPCFAAMELIAGCRNAREEREAWEFLAAFEIVWPEQADLERALTAYAPLYRTHGIGVPDMLIAAVAVGRALPLATLNVRHFRAVPGLVTVQPYVR